MAGVEARDRSRRKLGLVKAERPPGDVDGALAQRLVHRDRDVAVAADSGAIAESLVDRLADGGLVLRSVDSDNQRRVLLRLTERAESCLAELSAAHLDELRRIEPVLKNVLSLRKSDQFSSG